MSVCVLCMQPLLCSCLLCMCLLHLRACMHVRSITCHVPPLPAAAAAHQHTSNTPPNARAQALMVTRMYQREARMREAMKHVLTLVWDSPVSPAATGYSASEIIAGLDSGAWRRQRACAACARSCVSRGASCGGACSLGGAAVCCVRVLPLLASWRLPRSWAHAVHTRMHCCAVCDGVLLPGDAKWPGSITTTTQPRVRACMRCLPLPFP